MSRRFIKLILILLISLTILVGLTRLVVNSGNRSTVPILLQTSSECTFGCWHGIYIGKTTMSEAEGILKEGHFPVTADPHNHYLTWTETSGTMTRGWIYPFRDRSGNLRDEVDVISLELNNESLTLGDAIVLWGTPIGTTTHFCFSNTNGYFTIYFEGNVQIQVNPAKQINHVSLSPSALTPYTTVTHIDYVSNDNTFVPRELQNWKGFIQFPPNYLISDYCG